MDLVTTFFIGAGAVAAYEKSDKAASMQNAVATGIQAGLLFCKPPADLDRGAAPGFPSPAPQLLHHAVMELNNNAHLCHILSF